MPASFALLHSGTAIPLMPGCHSKQRFKALGSMPKSANLTILASLNMRLCFGLMPFHAFSPSQLWARIARFALGDRNHYPGDTALFLFLRFFSRSGVLASSLGLACIGFVSSLLVPDFAHLRFSLSSRSFIHLRFLLPAIDFLHSGVFIRGRI